MSDSAPCGLMVNVDVDALALYRAIHGLSPAEAETQAWTVGVPRFLDLFAALNLKATFFVVASDLRVPAQRAVAERIVAAGHEVANHSWSHPYDLVRLPRVRLVEEVERAHVALSGLAQGPVVGYRAPGYNQADAVRDVLARLGYRYDSSAFPCPPYVLAKAAVMAWMALRGRRSRAILANPWAALAGRGPRRLRAGDGAHLWSLPISVLPAVRFPLIGTAFTALGPRATPLLGALMGRMRYLNVEFHAVDLLGLADDGLDPALTVQPDLRVPVATKRALFEAVLGPARDRLANLTLADYAARLDRSAF